MTELYRFFAGAVGDDREYDQAEFARVFKQIQANGVIDSDVSGLTTNLLVAPTVPSGMAVAVAAGAAFVEGYYYENTATKTLAIDAADPSNPRIDAVVIRLDELVNRTIVAAVVKGTPAVIPIVPTPTRANGIYEIVLAYVPIPAGATAITVVTDKRGDSTVCGWSEPTLHTAVRFDPKQSLQMNSNRITQLAAPAGDYDAATKQYVDTVAGGGGGGGGTTLPAGVMMYWGGSNGSIPSGWLLCDGRYVNIADYSALWGVIGEMYGARVGDTFKLPDGRSNVVGGYDSRYPLWNDIGVISGEMSHATTSTGSQNLVQWLVVGGVIIKT